ncbi:hypothetical protein JMN32_08800 [Fulvivirga sp. 29W222]|uniref:Uncharacterized protein n=1 Tax=Fulvivirga marina TaxID=2494733 RepID=A0A937KBQ6_9BACT|nr:hypothetical protein [Fulvivirga marina]MBL6446404.1 hypothetical protein [Fulvivirga marina]
MSSTGYVFINGQVVEVKKSMTPQYGPKIYETFKDALMTGPLDECIKNMQKPLDVFPVIRFDPLNLFAREKIDCSKCNGRGKVDTGFLWLWIKVCSKCEGKGFVYK